MRVPAWQVVALGVLVMGGAGGQAEDGFDRLVRQVGVARSDSATDASLAASASDAAVARRKRMVIAAGAADPLHLKGRNPKHRFPVVMCRLAVDPSDEAARKYVAVGLRFRGQGDMFGKSSLSRLFCQFGRLLGQDVTDALRQEVTTYPGWLGGGTENHVTMRRTAGFLFGEHFPDATFHHDLTGKQLAGECREYMRRYGRAIYAANMAEHLSPTYHAVNTAAWVNVVEFAKDDTARLLARAVLDWMLADFAVNSHQGIVIPPIERAKGLLTNSYQLSYARTLAQWTDWLYWGGGNTPQQGPEFPDAKYLPLQPYGMCATLHALSTWMPHPVIRHIGAKRLRLPYMLWQSHGSWPCVEGAQVNAFGKTRASHQGPCDPRYVMRSVYVDRHYAMGVGYRKETTTDPILRTARGFSVVWRSHDDHHVLFAVHPYWYPERTWPDSADKLGDEDWAGVSPFGQFVHWENAAVAIYDLPERDPYTVPFGKGSARFRSQRTDRLIQCVYLYVPATVDERRQTSAGFFLREGDVYVAIRPLHEGAAWQPSRHEGHVRLAMPGSRVGFAIELGDRREFGSFDAFCAKVAATRLDVSRLDAAKEVTYRSARGHVLRLRHKSPGWLPDASINGAPLDFARWPLCESPYVRCRDRVLDVTDGHDGFTIDWRGELPTYTYYTQTDTGRTVTRREWIEDGKLLTR